MESHDLRNIIVNLINRSGKITFADFMELALYHPEYGYYSSENEKIGKRGDYYTSSDVHSVFGELVAGQLEQMWRIMGKRRFSVVEMGAGKGWLCRDIIAFVKKTYPEFYEKISYRIVEISQSLIQRQRDILKGLEEKISWEFFSADGFLFDPVEGCFLSNEFFDSLPVHRVIVDDDACLKEIYVAVKDGVFYEVIDGLSTTELRNYFERLKIDLREGQRAEVNLRALDWMKKISCSLKKGFVITIDYGHLYDNLYAEERNRGTLMCYYGHTTNENPYERIGRQDITTHIDFSSIMHEGSRFGLSTTGFTRQSNFLIALGILNRMNEAGGNIGKRLTMKNLFLPGGMGDVFKVLIQHKGIDRPELIGLRSMSDPELIREIEGWNENNVC